MRRLTSLRFETRGQDALYQAKQRLFISSSKEFLASIAIIVTSELEAVNYKGKLLEMLEHYADPHPKKKLRINSKEELEEAGRLYEEYNNDYVTAKLKKDEIAKAGPTKLPRIIIDLSVPASLAGFMITKYMKKAVAEHPLSYAGGALTFVASPSVPLMRLVLNNLIDPPGRYSFVCHSDDACFAIRINGMVYTYNLDIKNCDASHTNPLFLALAHLIPPEHREDIMELVRQCKLPIRLHNPHDKNEFVEFNTTRYRLYSGSTLTTIINVLASYLIGKALADHTFTEDDVEKQIENCATSVGYTLSIQRCHIPEDIQFLKHSPALDVCGIYQPVLNLGVLLRLSGTCRGDYPGRGDIRVRAANFQHSLLQGAFPYVDTPFINNMKRVGAPDPVMARHLAPIFEYKIVDPQIIVLTTDALFKRYRLTELEILEMMEFSLSTVGQYTSNSGANKILLADYELEAVGGYD
jgi:hypothetical protein